MIKRLWTGATVVALALSVIALAPARATPDVLADAAPLRIDMSGWVDRTTAVPLAMIGPETAVGVGPGTFLIIDGIHDDDGTYGCTANYVWQAGSQRYLGAAGHCFLPAGATASHGQAPTPVDGVRVRACVARCHFGGQLGAVFIGDLVTLGRVAYARQTEGGVDVGNDFGIVEIPEGMAVRTTMPVFGGPDAVGAMSPGDTVCHYGNGLVVGEVWPTMGRVGVGIETIEEEGWWLAALAALPGDSGAAVQVCTVGLDGVTGVAAAGVLTHLAPPGGVAGTSMARAMEMTRDDVGIDIVPLLGDPSVVSGIDQSPPDGGSVSVTVEVAGTGVTVRV